MAEEDFEMGKNPNEEEYIPPEKPEKIEIKSEKREVVQKSDFLNISTSKQFLESIEYASLKLEKSVKDLKGFDELGEIKKHLSDLKNVKLDTSSFEEQFETVLNDLKNKMEDLKDKVDLNELDEISTKLTEINKKTKHQKNWGYFFVALLAFGLGFFVQIESVKSKVLDKNEISIIEEFKEKGKINIGIQEGIKFIILKDKLINSGNNKAIIIQKNKGK